MLPLKLRYILGSFAFAEIFSAKKYTLHQPNIFFENTMENQFFGVFLLTETLQKQIRIELWTFSFQICFWNQFSTSGSGQTENTQIPVFFYFPFDHFPKSKIDFESRFEKRMHIFLF